MPVKTDDRNGTIIRTNIGGIVMNLLLSTAKAIIGFMVGSRAIRLDALNGFSDVVSSIVSILATSFAAKRADRQHPFGYGRLEYIGSMFGTVFVLLMGVHAICGAVHEIRTHAPAPYYNRAAVVLMAVSMAVKLGYGIYSRRVGRRIDSTALIMSGTESIGDSVVSASILLTILIHRASGINLEPWLSILISLFLMKTGLDLLRECVNKLLGTPADPELCRRVKKRIAEEDAVLNVFNLVIHQYGEELSIGSVDVEVDEAMTAAETTLLVRRIRLMSEELGVTLSSIGICGANIRDAHKAEMWDRILGIVKTHPEVLRAYAFCYDEARHTACFVVVVNPDVRDKKAQISLLRKELCAVFPGTDFVIETALEA